jgi:hypothetical protein
MTTKTKEALHSFGISLETLTEKDSLTEETIGILKSSKYCEAVTGGFLVRLREFCVDHKLPEAEANFWFSIQGKGDYKMLAFIYFFFIIIILSDGKSNPVLDEISRLRHHEPRVRRYAN